MDRVRSEPNVVHGIGKVGELSKARALYPVPLWRSIVESIALDKLEKKLNHSNMLFTPGDQKTTGAIDALRLAA